ncbi:hypothetical protein RND71_006931 [Anisodus tanguticus]|uniref:Uncharacterized protein n=1 Tax=Anisodus tanguticus TaxID=243964 RepID=A0AAE1VW17_9SOLA|nr:hypothetical protein RND71_006931 [Anisodus tanguticus]
MINGDYYVINLFATEDCELDVDVPNILNYVETDEPNLESVDSYVDSADPNVEPNVEPNVDIVEPSLGVATDCSSTEGGDENDSGSSAYESDELEFFANQMRVNINYQLLDYKELDGCMTFKDIPGARKCMKLYALANKKELQVVKSDSKILRYECQVVTTPFEESWWYLHFSPVDEPLPITKTMIYE